MNAATVNNSRPMAQASCEGRRLRRYWSATATANAPDTSAVTSGSTTPRLASANDERPRDDTQDCGTYDQHRRERDDDRADVDRWSARDREADHGGNSEISGPAQRRQQPVADGRHRAGEERCDGEGLRGRKGEWALFRARDDEHE